MTLGWNNKRTKFCLARNDAVADPARVDIAVGVCVCVCMRERELIRLACPFYECMVVVWGARSETMLSSERNCADTDDEKVFCSRSRRKSEFR